MLYKPETIRKAISKIKMKKFKMSFASICFYLMIMELFEVDGFYLPGVKMVTYEKGQYVPLYVNSYTSAETLLPIDYYKLPMCEPQDVEYQSENLGEYLSANRIKNSPFKIQFLEDKSCALICQREYDSKDINQFNDMIKNHYRVHWIMDNLPVASEPNPDIHLLGFHLGEYDPLHFKTPSLNNHVSIKIGYHIAEGSTSGGRIVDFAAIPSSFDYSDKDFTNAVAKTCDASGSSLKSLFLMPSNKERKVVYWTYSVQWIEMKDREWRTRWDVYFELGSGNDNVHWFSIINALFIVLFLSGMVGVILMRSLHRDISRYNRVPTEEERIDELEESGWKLVHADVFRSPSRYPMLFCVCVGTGCQLFGMLMITLLFAAMGFLSPSNRGNLMVAFLVVFVLMGTVAGYNSARTYKMFKGKKWQACTSLTAVLFPGLTFGVFFLLNLFAWASGSDAAVPFGSMVLLLLLWFGISVPLVFSGAWLAFRKPAIEFPVATSNIPRPIPTQPWYMSNFSAAVIGGILPFGAIFVELFFILTSIWTNEYYYVFGFLLLAILILINTCAEITIVMIYFQLCGEDYHWWWKSFIVSGSCGLYVFVYSVYYYYTRLDVNNFVGSMLYFGYMILMSGGISLFTGSIGFYSSFWFTKKIYGSIKVD